MGIWENKTSCFVSSSASSPLKGTITLLRAISLLVEKYPDIQLRLAGDYPWSEYTEILNKRIKRLNISKHIIFLGRLNPEDIYAELLNSQIFIQPSYIDNSPNALCEALLTGVPTISGFSGGIPSLVTENETGILYNATDPYDLAGKISNLFEDEIFMKKLSKGARAAAFERHDPYKTTQHLIDIYMNVLLENNISG